METTSSRSPLLLASIEMGYGHLRAAQPLAELLGTPIARIDSAPLADPEEEKQWGRLRRAYEGLSRLSQTPTLGAPLRALLEGVTKIPHLHPVRDLTSPTLGSRLQELLISRHGLGRGLVRALQQTGQTLVATHFIAALAADRAGCAPVYCVVTDADIHRVWAPLDPHRSPLQYLVPTRRAMHRLEAYGVPSEHIHFTGFPLPHSLLGGPSLGKLRENLAARLVRLDPAGTFRNHIQIEIDHFLSPLPSDQEGEPPRLVFAVGGAGAQVEIARMFLPGMRRMLASGRLWLSLVAGVRRPVAERFEQLLAHNDLDDRLGKNIEILYEDTIDAYLTRFNRLIEHTDILWTKPSEVTFLGALGIPLVFSWPVGEHERYNRRWAVEQGAGLKQRDPWCAADWLQEWLQDGTLAFAAWSGYMRLPKFGTYGIAEILGTPASAELAGQVTRQDMLQ